ncbi:MAG: hypothetical protein IJ736_11400, partial [Firmicutes bacterium]|nr:hypothetical protein [Bacillota bacterium]
MSTPKMLALLDKICEDRGRVLDLARYYIADDIRTFHNAEECVLVKDGKSIEFDRIEDFNDLKEKVKEIEKSKKLTPYFFQIHDDVEKIRFLMNKKILVPVSNVQNQPNLVIEEAQRIIDIAHKYIFIACSDKDYLDQRFEVFRIKHLMMEGSDYDHIRNDEEIDKIAAELNKIKFFFKEKMVVKVEDVQADYEMLDGLFAILEKIDSRLYDEQFYPDKKLYKALLASKEDYDKKCNFTYKMIAQDIPRLFARVKQNGAAICLDKPQRYQSEKNALLKRMET